MQLQEATAPDPRTTRYEHLFLLCNFLTLQLPFTNAIQDMELSSISSSLANWEICMNPTQVAWCNGPVLKNLRQQSQSGMKKIATFCLGILQKLDYGLVACQAFFLL